MNSFNGTWVDQQNVVITINGPATAVTVVYSNGRGPFQGTINTSTSQITVNFTDDGGNKTGTLSNKNSEINWDNGTTWNYCYLRKNAWDDNNGGQFTNADGSPTNLYWYAKGVQQMQTLPVSNPLSWWFFAAIHGEYLTAQNATNNGYPNWVDIPYILTSANLGTLPSPNLITLFWDQCQHGTWYFAPWHRGYLVALEVQLRTIISGLTVTLNGNTYNGPYDWALPYWNYLSQSPNFVENEIPKAFTVQTLPDTTPNPLYVVERYGPDGNSSVFVQVGNAYGLQANDECQWDNIYSESSPKSKGPGNLNGYFYGGDETVFQHSPNSNTFGDLENNPHNLIHVMVGGESLTSWVGGSASIEGLMSDPGIAALDPIFYLHHANIDRMWAAWNNAGNNNPKKSNWLNGPGSNAGDEFAMPVDSQGTPWIYTPNQMQHTNNLPYYNGQIYSYTYNDLSLTSYNTTPPLSLQQKLEQRVKKLGGTELITQSMKMSNNPNTELAGASATKIELKNGGTNITVKVDAPVWKTFTESLSDFSASNIPNRFFLQLEGVTGNSNSNMLIVYINQKIVKAISLFGLSVASQQNAKHGGNGITYKFDITDVADELHLNEGVDLKTLDVQIKTKNPIASNRQITIGRVAIYRVD